MSNQELFDILIGAEIKAPRISKRIKGERVNVAHIKLVLLWLATTNPPYTTNAELARVLGLCTHWAASVMQTARLLGLVSIRRVALPATRSGGRSGTRYTLNLPAIRALPRVRAGVAA